MTIRRNKTYSGVCSDKKFRDILFIECDFSNMRFNNCTFDNVIFVKCRISPQKYMFGNDEEECMFQDCKCNNCVFGFDMREEKPSADSERIAEIDKREKIIDTLDEISALIKNIWGCDPVYFRGSEDKKEARFSRLDEVTLSRISEAKDYMNTTINILKGE